MAISKDLLYVNYLLHYSQFNQLDFCLSLYSYHPKTTPSYHYIIAHLSIYMYNNSRLTLIYWKNYILISLQTSKCIPLRFDFRSLAASRHLFTSSLSLIPITFLDKLSAFEQSRSLMGIRDGATWCTAKCSLAHESAVHLR